VTANTETRADRWRHPNEGPENRAIYAREEAIWRRAAAQYAAGDLIDIGCGEKPLQPFFAPYVDRYVGVDHAETEHDLRHADLVGTAYAVPLPDASADTVILSQVLEHLERPPAALSECLRLLRPGGHLLLATPFFWQSHEEPRDFYRYSPYGLRYLLTDAGFEVVEVVPYCGAWLTVAVEIGYALRAFRGGRLDPLVVAATSAVQRFGSWADRRNFQPRFSAVHFAAARKPGVAPADEQNLQRPVER
jgi:SAM-dependent methyltransferase